MLREAALNVAAGTTRATSFGFAFAALVVLFGGAEAATMASLSHQAETYRSSGGSTVVYRMEEGISAEACDSLVDVASIRAAGAMRRSAGITATQLPSQQIPTFEISPGFGAFTALGRPSTNAGILVSDDLADTLGAVDGEPLTLTSGTPEIGAVFTYPSDGRLPGYGYSILSRSDSRAPYDECWFEAWPATDSIVSLASTTLIPGAVSGSDSGGRHPQLLQLNASHGTRFDGEFLFNERITRFAPAAAALAALALGAVSVLRRRLEYASARHAGVGVCSQAIIVAAETSIWTAFGTVIALAVLASQIAAAEVEDQVTLWPLGARVIAAASAAAAIGATASTLLVRERHLFEYFKSR